MNTLSLKILGIHIKVDTDFAKYGRFVEDYFDKVRCSDDEPAQIHIEIRSYGDNVIKYINEKKSEQNFSQVGVRTLLGENRLVTFRKLVKRHKVIFDIERKENSLQCLILFHRTRSKNIFQYGALAKDLDGLFFTLTYYFIYYPLFWYLEQSQHKHPLHAGALEYRGKGLVICGLEGIGKTALSSLFLREESARFFSDNIMFHDGEKLYPCFEMVRLHPGEQDESKQMFERSKRFTIGKEFYEPRQLPDAKGIVPETMIFPEFGAEFKVKELTKEEAANRAVASSYIPSELCGYSEYRNLFNLLDLKDNPGESQQKSMKSLLNGVRCYRIVMPKADGLKRNFERLKNVIDRG